MRRLFAVMRRYGPPYDPGRPLEEQQDWEAHRAFMNALEADGLVRRATKSGPLPRFKPIKIAGPPISQTIQDERDER